MGSLYLLSLLLTGDHEKAEQSFVAGLENAVKRNTVFKEWARSWARRVIIQNATRIMNPQPSDENEFLRSVSTGIDDRNRSEPVEIAAVLGLRTFDRFIFVMSVLESYSDLDCSLLLSCSRRDVRAARVRALQQIGTAAELFRGLREDADQDVPTLAGIDGSALDSKLHYAKSA